ncbi:MAG: PqqD family protein [Clostridiales bacterium]|nr:PqqD family protein [Clostridiales bacterium]
MKIKTGYVVRQVMDTYLVIGIGSENYVPNQIMSLNETGAFLWKLLETGAEKSELLDSLMKEYEVDAETAEKDVDAFLTSLRERSLITE